MNVEPLDWQHTYLLGWYDRAGRAYLSSWSGSMPRIEVVVVGHSAFGPPLWNAPVPTGCLAYPIPDTLVDMEARLAYAASLGGVYAFGWRTSETINRSVM